MNKVYRIKKNDFEEQKILHRCSDVTYYVMNGKNIDSYEDYFDELWKTFGFSEVPTGWKKNYHTENDFFTDQEEVKGEKIVFAIMNYSDFMRDNEEEKAEIEDYYENYLLPFWDNEAEKTVVGGKRKDFDIYLVSN